MIPEREPEAEVEQPAGAAPQAPRPLGWASATAARGPSDTVGTGSSCAIGCTVLMIALVLVAIAVYVVMRVVT